MYFGVEVNVEQDASACVPAFGISMLVRFHGEI